MVCEALRRYGVKAPIDVHLMVRPVDRIVPDFAAAGATYITFHPEASEHIDRTIALIREHGCRPGLVFNPATPLDYLDYTLELIDLVLIMSVNPGFGGQQFIPTSLRKLGDARARIAASGREVRLEVDGGVRSTTSERRLERERTPSSPARQSSAAATTARRYARCASRSRRRPDLDRARAGKNLPLHCDDAAAAGAIAAHCSARLRQNPTAAFGLPLCSHDRVVLKANCLVPSAAGPSHFFPADSIELTRQRRVCSVTRNSKQISIDSNAEQERRSVK
jgi:hypothetical protein